VTSLCTDRSVYRMAGEDCARSRPRDPPPISGVVMMRSTPATGASAVPHGCAVDANADLNALMGRLAEGDRAAFTPVFRLLWPPVHRLCLALTSNQADADDAAQQAMEKVLVRAHEYDSHRPALPWALAIAGWECRTLLRKRGRRREVADDLTMHPAPGGMADQRLEERDLVQAALTAMRELSDLDRETLVATFSEQAQASAGGATLRKRRERALGRLRTAFRRLYGLD